MFTNRNTKIAKLILAVALVASLCLSFTFSAFAATVSQKTASNTSLTSVFTNSKYVAVTNDDSKGIGIRATEGGKKSNEFALENCSTNFSKELYINDFALTFTINQDNFESLEFLFTSEYIQDWDYSINANNDLEDWNLNPSKVENKITLTKKADGKISAKVNDYAVVDVDANFKGQQMTLLLDGENTHYAKLVVGANTYKLSADAESLNAIANQKAKLKVTMANVYDAPKKSDDFAVNVYFSKVAYSNNVSIDGEVSTIEQSLLGSSTAVDTSMPIGRIDTTKLITYTDGTVDGGAYTIADTYACSVGTVLSIPVSQYDFLGSSTTVTTKYKYSATLPSDWYEKVDGKDKYITQSVPPNFEITEKGYYAIVEVSLSDGKNVVTLGKDDVIDGVKFPFVYRAIEQTKEVGAPVFDNKDYAQFVQQVVDANDISSITSTKNSYLALPYPTIGLPSTDAVLVDCIGEEDGIKYYLADSRAIKTYTLYNASSALSKTSASTSSLDYYATSAGNQEFAVVITDNKGFTSETQYMWDYKLGEAVDSPLNPQYISPFKFFFVDKQVAELTVTNSPVEKYINQSLSLPSASVSANFASPTSSVVVYLLGQDNVVFNYEVEQNISDETIYNVNGLPSQNLDSNDEIVYVDANGKKLDIKNRVARKATEEDVAYWNDNYKKLVSANFYTEPLGYEVGDTIYLDAQGRIIPKAKTIGDDSEVIDLVVSTSTSFTPKLLGNYLAVYTAENTANPELTAKPVYRYFSIVEEPEATIIDDLTNLSPWAIAFLIIAGVCLLAIILLFALPPVLAKIKDSKSKQ